MSLTVGRSQALVVSTRTSDVVEPLEQADRMLS